MHMQYQHIPQCYIASKLVDNGYTCKCCQCRSEPAYYFPLYDDNYPRSSSKDRTCYHLLCLNGCLLYFDEKWPRLSHYANQHYLSRYKVFNVLI